MKWNGQPLHEATKAEVEEVTNVSYTLKVDYPITDTEIYKKFQEDMLIIAPTPITGRQLFRIKEISEQDDTVNLTCQHITEDIFKRSVRPIKVSNSTCQIALNAMISAVKTPLGKFSFTSNIMDNRTFNTTEDETLYKILMDGKHSIVGAWEGEMIRDNFLIDIPKSRGIDRGVVITTHQNLKQYERNKSSSSIITRLHLKSTFKPEGAEEDTVLKVTVDSPLIGSYPYINEAEYENNDLTTEEELRKWGEAKFKNGDIDKSTDQIKVEAYELDGQTVHLGDTVTIMSLKHDVMLKKKAVGYVFDALSEEYISLTFDDKAGHGGGMSGSNGISDVASEILDTVQKTQEDDEYYKKLKVLVDNANRAFEDKAGALEKEITDGLEQAKAQAEVVKEEISAQVTEKIDAANQKNKNEIVEEFKAQYNGIEVKMEGFKATTDQLKASDADIQKLINDFKAQTQSQFVGVQGAQSRFEQTTEKAISDLTNVANGKADRSFVEQTVNGIREELTSIGVGGGPNMLRNSRADEGLKYWIEANNRLAFTAHKFYFNGQKRIFELRPGAVVKSPRFIVKQNADYTLNFLGFDNNSKMFKVYFCKRRKGSISDFEEKQLIYDGKPRLTDGPVLDGDRAIKKSFQFNVGNFDDGYLQFEYERNNPNKWGGLFLTELDFYEGTNDRLWQPAPEDQNYLVEQAQATFEKTVEGLSTQLTKLETKTGPSGELEQRMLTYSEKAAVDALKATRQILEQGYVAKSQYTEDVAGITRRFDEIVQAGENLLKNSGNPQNVEGWGYYDPGLSPAVTVSTNPIYYNESRKLFKLDNSTDNVKVAASQRFNIKRNTTYTISFDAIGSDNLKNATFYFLARKKGETGTFTKVVTLADKITVPQDRTTRYYFTVNTEDYDEAFLRFDNNGSSNGQSASLYFGDIDVYEGSIKRAYQPPTDNGSSVIEAKLAEYKQTVDGQFTTITNQMGDMLRKTDIQITPGQISFGTGKSINGRTISSLLVQEPEAIALIAQLIKVKGDMVVDGSITSRHLASQSVRTGHMESGSVTTQILASNAVTADKLLVDSAMINKFVSNQAFIRELISQQAFITELNSIKIAAERIQGGRLSANNGATVFDLDNGTINLFSNTGTIRRIDDTSSSQFIKFNQVGLIGEYLRDNKAARIVIGTNQDKTENTENGTFAGMRLWSGAKNDVKESLYELVGDRIIFYANGQYRSPWIIHNNTKDGNSYLIPMNEKGVKHNLGRGDKHFSKAYIDDLFIGKGSQNVGGYLWDILTCFGILARYGWDLKNGAVQNHIKSNLINKYGFK
ncbi:gp58-like family protein [Streptococcus parasanguinis]|uniref:phage tail spike protein n=1 Tax=Streptococcus parasanguinis TaxID=1318 RepID=UPI00232FFB0B|nr:phage tail spike protein [Streptococcus parasanguinis]MDB8620920.1 gp58-like family protein [Streptococcus parasanguinis]